MWQEIERLKSIVEGKRPLNPDMMKAIAQKFREEWTYHTNAIEGNTFTFQETAFFLREGLTIKGKTLREHLEIINHAEAISYLDEAIKGRDLTERLIKDFHALLFEGVKDINFTPGDYKMSDNHVLTVSGVIHRYCSYIHVPQEMEHLLAWYDQEKDRLHPIEAAALFHHKLTAIHPFTDGNGRVSRLCMNFILLKNGYVPAVIRNEHRLDYYKALEQADQQDATAIVNLLAEEVKRSLQMIIDHISFQ
ncbi:MAG: Fic family protein [Paenibacillaceae bacterium]